MKASELISQLVTLINEHGDLPIHVADQGCGCCAGDSYEADEPVFRKGFPAGNGYKHGKPDVVYLA